MQIFVTGGTGFLGSYLLRYLVQRGYTQIRALKRKNSPMALVEEVSERIEWIEGDILDVAVLESAMQGVQQVYHCAAVVSYDPKERDWLYEVNVQGTANVVDLALEVGIEKMVHISSIAALGRSKRNNQLDESAEWQGKEGQSHYSVSKYLAEMEVWRGIAESLNAAMINPSVILGSGFWEKGTGKIFMNAWNGFPFYPQGGTGFVDVRDVAKAAIQLMESDITAKRYIINAANLSYKDQMFQMSKALNKKPPSIKVTPLIQEVAWRLAALQGFFLRKRPFITKETARMSAKRYYYNAQKSITDLDMNYIPFEQTVQETSQQLEQASKEGFRTKYLPLK
ncbi:MAG: NAD-dependent epimerase/dehydratase family protein [Bacteroidota bacterium]